MRFITILIGCNSLYSSRVPDVTKGPTFKTVKAAEQELFSYENLLIQYIFHQSLCPVSKLGFDQGDLGSFRMARPLAVFSSAGDLLTRMW